MRILMITTTIYDERSAFNHLLKSLLEGFIAHDFLVERIVAVNKNESNKESLKLGIKSEKIKYTMISRKTVRKSNFVFRFITDYLSSLKLSLYASRCKNTDVIIEDMTYSSIIPILYAKYSKIPVVLMVQDIWPENAVESGFIKRNGLIYRIFSSLQDFVYHNSKSIITISDDMKQLLVSKGIAESKISVIYNWGYSDEIYQIAWKENIFAKKYNLDQNKFYVIYAGNIGKLQNIDVIIKAADVLRNESQIRFLIVGEGVSKDEKINLANELCLENLDFLPMQPPEHAPHIYSCASVNIIPLIKGGVKTALPSKTGICLSCGKPIILCVEKDSLYAKLIIDNGAGYVSDPNDYIELANHINELKRNQSIDTNNVYSCFRKNFLKSNNVDKYCEIIKNTITK